MKSESYLRRAFTTAIRATGNMATPIESGTTGLGIPDMYVRTPKTSVWIEFKNEKFALCYPYEVSFRPGQYLWLKKHMQLGGTSLLVVGSPEGIFVFKNECIRQVYDKSLNVYANLIMQVVDGRKFVNWLDKLSV